MTRSRVVIVEFMDETAVAALAAAHDTRYDPGLVDREADLLRRRAPMRMR